ncbi:tail fiber protein [Shigella sonnei]|nr:tail fiber protein [Shigella sonnei]
MSVVISGALTDGAGIPMSGCQIILKSRVNTSEVVMRTRADVVTGNNGEYSFEAQVGKYCVYLKRDWRDEYCVGDIAVYDDSKPGTLNDFLIAPDEGDLKPDVVKRFEEMVAQAQQSAGAAAGNAQQTAQDVAAAAGYARAAEQAKNDIDVFRPDCSCMTRLFFGSDHGGERGALLYSLIGTCKLNGVEPESYLRYVLDVIADWPINRVGELLPWRVALPTE